TKFITEAKADITVSIEQLNETYPQLPVWSSALSTTFIISVVPYMILFLIPLNANTPQYVSHLRICLGLAAGGLLGDAFLHLIPESLNANNSADHLSVGLWILGGFLGFFIIEKIVRLVKNYSISARSSRKEVAVNGNHNNNQICNNKSAFTNECPVICDKMQTKQDLKENPVLDNYKDIDISGYLNLVADLVHNFTDGLAIGSSFMAGHNVGLVTGIAIMVHEIPHEIGDYAVLIKSGCSQKRAMSLQLLTAIGALTGTVVSLALGNTGDMSGSWVLPFTGGGFVYIGTVTILPELTQQTDLIQTFKELFALLFGIFIMVLIV
ncbi:unnamed protein product, partial [Oppiella nova]